jgi:hypothetical protein
MLGQPRGMWLARLPGLRPRLLLDHDPERCVGRVLRLDVERREVLALATVHRRDLLDGIERGQLRSVSASWAGKVESFGFEGLRHRPHPRLVELSLVPSGYGADLEAMVLALRRNGESWRTLAPLTSPATWAPLIS